MSPRHTQPPSQARTPRVLQPKAVSVRQAPEGAAARHAPPPFTPSGVVQLGAKKRKPKTRTYALISRGTGAKPIRIAKRIKATKDEEGRIANVRAAVGAGNKVGRKSTTKHKTTDTSGPINYFLRNAKLLSRIIRMEGGHCVADVFGGSLCKSNTVPLPHAFNTIAYKKEETALKKTLPTTTTTTMEVSVEYPKNPLEGFLSEKDQRKLRGLVSTAQYEKLEALFSDVPDFMAWEVNTTSGGHKWIEFRDIRKDIWPRGHKPKQMLTKDFIKAVKRL